MLVKTEKVLEIGGFEEPKLKVISFVPLSNYSEGKKYSAFNKTVVLLAPPTYRYLEKILQW